MLFGIIADNCVIYKSVKRDATIHIIYIDSMY